MEVGFEEGYTAAAGKVEDGVWTGGWWEGLSGGDWEAWGRRLKWGLWKGFAAMVGEGCAERGTDGSVIGTVRTRNGQLPLPEAEG